MFCVIPLKDKMNKYFKISERFINVYGTLESKSLGRNLNCFE